nr:DUF1674 domain-containing protein [Aureimonas mangrovi]
MPGARPREADGTAPRPLSPAARRALEEANERRAKATPGPGKPEEVNGRDGPEPTRFGDWEKNGIISDF